MSEGSIKIWLGDPPHGDIFSFRSTLTPPAVKSCVAAVVEKVIRTTGREDIRALELYPFVIYTDKGEERALDWHRPELAKFDYKAYATDPSYACPVCSIAQSAASKALWCRLYDTTACGCGEGILVPSPHGLWASPDSSALFASTGRHLLMFMAEKDMARILSESRHLSAQVLPYSPNRIRSLVTQFVESDDQPGSSLFIRCLEEIESLLAIEAQVPEWGVFMVLHRFADADAFDATSSSDSWFSRLVRRFRRPAPNPDPFGLLCPIRVYGFEEQALPSGILRSEPLWGWVVDTSA